jgi:hypothetical protein
MYCYVYRKAGPDIAGKTEFVTEKKFIHESLVYQNKTKSLNKKNISMWYQKKQSVDSTGLFLAKKICEKVLFFASRGHLQALKVCDLKLLCPSQLCSLKDWKIKVRI